MRPSDRCGRGEIDEVGWGECLLKWAQNTSQNEVFWAPKVDIHPQSMGAVAGQADAPLYSVK